MDDMKSHDNALDLHIFYSHEKLEYVNLGNYFFAQPVYNLRRPRFLLRIMETANNIWPGKH